MTYSDTLRGMNPQADHQVEWRLGRHPRSVARARSLLSVQAAEWKVHDEAAETSVLLLSELVTNALRHAGCAPGREIWTRALLDAGARRLRVEVSDACNFLPHARNAPSHDETGRGLALVAALSERWGAERRACGIGKTVWFELASVRC